MSMSVALYNTSRAMLFVGIVGIEEVEKLVEEMQSFTRKKDGNYARYPIYILK